MKLLDLRVPRNKQNTAKLNNLPINDVELEPTLETSKFAFELLEVGQSTVLYRVERHTIKANVTNLFNRRGLKFAVDKLEKGVRVWRVA